MGAIFGIIILVIYFYLCHKVASKASNNGKNYFIWFLISAFIDPIFAFVLLYPTSKFFMKKRCVDCNTKLISMDIKKQLEESQ